MISGLIVIAVVVTTIFILHKNWVQAEVSVLHNRIDTTNAQISEDLDKVKNSVTNAKSIASNALSSAQRAESKIIKATTDVVVNQVETIEGEVKNA